MPRLTESRALRATLPQSGQAFLWCSEVRGFGCRLLATGVRSWVVQVRYERRNAHLSREAQREAVERAAVVLASQDLPA
jgi:hypothetical protein